MVAQQMQEVTKENTTPISAGGPRGQPAQGDETASVSEVTGGVLGFQGTPSPPQILMAG